MAFPAPHVIAVGAGFETEVNATEEGLEALGQRGAAGMLRPLPASSSRSP